MNDVEKRVRKQQGKHFTTVEISPETKAELLFKCDEWSDDLGSLNGSIENGDGNAAGRFGELLFTEIFGGEIKDHYEYDVWYNGLEIDVKTKRRTVAPKPHYEASIADWNPDQNCDLYYFISLLGSDADSPYSKAWLCGYIPPDVYHDKATFYEEGDVDTDNGFVFKADCYNLEYGELRRHEDIEPEVTI